MNAGWTGCTEIMRYSGGLLVVTARPGFLITAAA